MRFVKNSFPFICDTIKNQTDCQQTSQQCLYQIMELLKSLIPKEKVLIANYFCQLPLRIGTLRVLHILQNLGIITAAEYIYSSIHNLEKVQLVINELLKTEYELLSNLFLAATYDSTICTNLSLILEYTINGLFTKFVEHRKVENLDYVQTLCSYLPAEALTKAKYMHINALLRLHTSSIQEAYSMLSTWINEGVDELIFINILCKQLFSHNQVAFSYLLQLSTDEQFKEWKFYLILVQSIASSGSTEISNFIKKYLKNRLVFIAHTPSKLSFLHLLLTARAAAATSMDVEYNLNAYANWYKHNIGEMSYFLDVEGFKAILGLLQESLSYETEPQYLETHLNIAISPSPLCVKLVHAYKTECKAHLSRLKADIKRKAREAHLT